MNTHCDPELLAFAGEVLEASGGVVERRGNHLLAMLPEEVAARLGIPGECELGSQELPLLYGSPLLDRLVDMATGEVPLVYGQILVPYLKKAGFEDLFGKDLAFSDGRLRVTGRAETRTTYMVLTCHYVALSDERKEGLVQVAVHENSGAVIDGLQDIWRDCEPQLFPLDRVPPHFPTKIETAVESALRSAKAEIEGELVDFLASMQRRLCRDAKNTQEYYAALEKEMTESLSHSQPAPGQRETRLAKIRDLPGEMERKIDDLRNKYRVEVTITACAAVRLLVNVVQIMVDLWYRKQQRAFHVLWNPLTRRLDPLVCESCRKTITRICPTGGDPGVGFLCRSCLR